MTLVFMSKVNFKTNDIPESLEFAYILSVLIIKKQSKAYTNRGFTLFAS